MQFWFEKHRSDPWNPKGMFSAPSGRSGYNDTISGMYIKVFRNLNCSLEKITSSFDKNKEVNLEAPTQRFCPKHQF